MKQEEKTRITYERILKAAIAEFGTKSYESASLNVICSENQLSKGLVYHNFKNKDDLYLRCVELCFQTITAYLRSKPYHKNGSARDCLRELLVRRQSFFEGNPYMANIFFGTMLQPPVHLLRELREIRREFDAFHLAYYQEQLASMHLREGVTMEAALQYFSIFQDAFNGYYRNKFSESGDFPLLVQEHEQGLSSLLDILLYGIAKEPQ